ncbi:hypothetical protein TYRP_021303 [Tyrophagus putrescentiae]|nr:hypothetical protein TYRP_021303 [Tyrophagus putrescentiae]
MSRCLLFLFWAISAPLFAYPPAASRRQPPPLKDARAEKQTHDNNSRHHAGSKWARTSHFRRLLLLLRLYTTFGQRASTTCFYFAYAPPPSGSWLEPAVCLVAPAGVGALRAARRWSASDVFALVWALVATARLRRPSLMVAAAAGAVPLRPLAIPYVVFYQPSAGRSGRLWTQLFSEVAGV